MDTRFEITLRDGTTESVVGADAYQPDSRLTTFYRTANCRGTVDGWATRIASYRTDDIRVIRRHGSDAARRALPRAVVSLAG